MDRTFISVVFGGISRRSDPLGQIYGWIPSVDLLGSVTRVPYLLSLNHLNHLLLSFEFYTLKDYKPAYSRANLGGLYYLQLYLPCKK